MRDNKSKTNHLSYKRNSVHSKVLVHISSLYNCLIMKRRYLPRLVDLTNSCDRNSVIFHSLGLTVMNYFDN